MYNMHENLNKTTLFNDKSTIFIDCASLLSALMPI